MFGLGKKTKPQFEFDLEKDLKADPTKMKTLQKTIDERMHSIKGVLREGSSSEHFDDLGAILQAYTALQRVLNRITNKK